MSTPKENVDPTDAEERAKKSEVEGRTSEPDTTTVPQDGAISSTSVPQDDA